MSTKTLIVLRHAKSSWDTDCADHERPLSARGSRDAVAAGKILADYHIDYLLSSTATRARQTWEGAKTAGASADLEILTDLIYHAWPTEIITELRGLNEDAQVVLLIGHQPTLADLITTLAKPSDLLDQLTGHFPTSGLAVLTHPGPWKTLAAGKATLTRFEIPRG
jgi:phosphohistidine phosphatase